MHKLEIQIMRPVNEGCFYSGFAEAQTAPWRIFFGRQMRRWIMGAMRGR